MVWEENENALGFGDHGTALSSRAFGFDGDDGSSCSLEIWFEPARIWTTGSLLTFYSSLRAEQFSIQQDYTDLILQRELRDRGHQTSETQIRVDDVFRRQQAFITITSDGQNTSVYLDGHLVTKSPRFGLSVRDLSGQLILANSPLRAHRWPGQLRGLAIYGSNLSPEQVVRHYQDWTQRQRPVLIGPERALAVYLFNEHLGTVAHNAIRSGIDLNIPSHYLVVDQLLFEPPWQEFHTQQNYLENCIINIAGFVPLGFFFSLYFTVVCKTKRASVAAILLGGAVSLIIEFCQAYLPTRYSGMTDVITNILGTCLGVVLYRTGVLLLARLPVLDCEDRHSGTLPQ